MLRLSRLLLPMLTGILLLAGYGQASDIDNILAKAKEDGKSVMLEIGSVGCISCEQMKPVMQKLRGAYKGKLEVIFIDVRQNNKLARRFGVHVIPTQVFLDKDGNEFHRHIGYYSFEEIVPVLKQSGL
jgi:thioredoxin 1